MFDSFVQLSDECPSLGFSGKFGDVEALNRGDIASLRPNVARATRDRVSALPPPGHEVALVLGANGFIGAHLSARLSCMPEIRRVIATVRARDGEPPRKRLAQTLREYDVRDVDYEKIQVINASVTEPRLGLSQADYEELARDVDLVFNSASSTDYTSGYLELRDDWVKGLLRVLQLSIDGKRKHVSYLGTIGTHVYSTPADFRRPDSWWYNGYFQMKWVNGQILRWLADDGLFSVTLCEAPYVLGSTTVGRDPGLHYSWWRILEIVRSIGLIWDGPGMPYVPVDVLASALTINAVGLRTPLLRPRNPIPYDNRLLAALLSADVVDWERFVVQVASKVGAKYVRSVLSTDLNTGIRAVDQPAVFSPEWNPAWCDNRRLYEFYLRNLEFRDVQIGRRA